MAMKKNLVVALFILATTVFVHNSIGALYAQANTDWTEPFPPFKIAGNLYYV